MTTAGQTRGKKSFAGREGTRELSLKIALREQHALIGANGAGARDRQAKAVYLGEAGDA